MELPDLDTATAREVAAAIRRRAISPSEVMDWTLGRVAELDGGLNAVIWLDPDEARRLARSADDAVLRTEAADLPRFLGVPIPIKDVTAVAGWPLTFGSQGAADGPCPDDELVVASFVRAGLVPTGRTNTPELAALSVTENARYGTTVNPWNTSVTPGGSSGGAAAAVAAGMFSVAHGTDAGGSLRMPASCCGLVGLKPARGRVPVRVAERHGAVTDGVVTRDVADTAALLDVMSGPDPGTWFAGPRHDRGFEAEVGVAPGRLRVGVMAAPSFDRDVDPECMTAVRATASVLEGLGHDVFETDFSVPPELAVARSQTSVVDSAAADVDWSRVQPHLQERVRAARRVPAVDYVRMVGELQRQSRRIVARWGAELDVLLCPTMPVVAPRAGEILSWLESADDEERTRGWQAVGVMSSLSAVFNVTGQPAVSLPVHLDARGVPVGVQLVGAPWGEASLLRLAAQLESAMGWNVRRGG